MNATHTPVAHSYRGLLGEIRRGPAEEKTVWTGWMAGMVRMVRTGWMAGMVRMVRTAGAVSVDTLGYSWAESHSSGFLKLLQSLHLIRPIESIAVRNDSQFPQ